MNIQEAEALFDRYRRAETTEAENALIESWYLEEARASLSLDAEVDYDAKEQKIWARIQAKKQPVRKTSYTSLSRTLTLTRIAVAAAAAAVITLGVWLYYNPRHSGEGLNPETAKYINDIAPGTNAATLTLANGKTITLSGEKSGVVIGEELKYNDSTAVITDRHPGINHESGSGTGSEAIQVLTASTARGQTYQFTLPDGTRVWLNAASSISFPSRFSKEERNVTLIGEAYFEVSKDAKRKFKVRSAGQELTVLGTHFNVNSYPEGGETKTTLLEGSVRINGVVLKPGQQASLKADREISVTDVETDDAIAWKNGYFLFANENLEQIMTRIGRWYNVHVEFENPELKKEQFFGTVSRYENVSKVLNLLVRTNVVRFEIEGNTITVKEK